MPAWQGARSVPAAPSPLHAEPLGVLCRDPKTPQTLGRGWAWRGSARSVPAAGTATLWPSLPRHCHVPPAPADAQEAEPPQPGAPWHPQTPTWSWGSLVGCCQNPVPQFPPAVLSPSHSMGSSLPGPQPHRLIPLPNPIPTKTNSLFPSWANGRSMAPRWALQDPAVGLSPLSPIPFLHLLGMGEAARVPPSLSIHRKPHRGFGVFGCLSAASRMPTVPPRRTRGILEAGSRG